jgi:hypothetical protein
MITNRISTRLYEFNTRVLQPSPLIENLVPRLQAQNRGGYKKGTHTSLRREKLWVLGTEEILGPPCSLLLGVMAPLNIVESNHPSPHDLVMLTQKLH